MLADYWSKEALNSLQGVGWPPSVTLEILRKRFPSTYGSNPRNTLETFLHRNEQGQPDPGQAMGVAQLNDRELAEKIAVLEKRHAHFSDLA